MLRPAIAFLVALLCVSAQSQSNPYEILDYGIDIDLRKDGWMSVTETLEVSFAESRRGIFRKLPVDLETGRGTTRRILVKNISVTDPNGARYTTSIGREGTYLNVRIGDKDIWMPPGTQKTYVIHYDAFGMLNWPKEDSTWEPSVELYWNLIGPEWDTSVGRVHFSVKAPEVDPKHMRARLFVGPYGTTRSVDLNTLSSTNTDQIFLDNGVLRGGVASGVGPFTGVTLVLNLPANAIEQPSFVQAAALFLWPNLGFTIPVLILVGMLPIWFVKGRDPRGGPMVVQFEPPDGMSGPEVGTLIDERVDQRDLAAGMISLAVKGYIEIFPEEEGMIFKRRTAELELTGKQPGDDLSPFETKLLAMLGTYQGRITETDLRMAVAPQVGELRGALYGGMVDRGYYITDPETSRTMWILAGMLVVAALGFLFYWLSPTREVMPSIVGGVIGGGLVFLIGQGMPRRTKKGSEARMRTVGFAEFIKRARGDELDWMSKKHPDQSLFEEYLPHAIAFGLTKEWAEAFKNIELAMPSWYHGPHGYWNPIWFASDMGAVSNSLSSAASVPPRSSGASGGSSGFGGGGFSGGGFGGGGGGSW